MDSYDKSRAWTEARELLVQHRARLGVGFVLMLINRLAGLVLPWTSKYLIDDIVGKHRGDMLLTLAALAGAATLVQAATRFAISQTVSIAAQRAVTKMRRRVNAHVLRLPVSYFDSTKTGVLVSRVMNDADGVRNLIGSGLVDLVGGMLTALMALTVLFYLNWRLTSAMLVVLVLFGGVMTSAVSRLRPMFGQRWAIGADVHGRLAETIGGVRLVKVYVAERRERLVFARGVHKLFRNVAGTIVGSSLLGAATSVLTGLIGVLLIVIGGGAILRGTMTLGDFVMYAFFIALMTAPLAQIAEVGTQVSEALAGLDRIREICDMPTEDQADAGKESITEVDGEVEFDDVTFEYLPETPVLEHLTFTAPAGSTTALVGTSGGGKSTLMALVLAFYRPTRGRVLVDGRDIATLRLREYRSHVGVVMQDGFLFDGSVRDNIAFSKPAATEAEIRIAARIAHCDEFVEQFEGGYDTIIGERGVKLSGGQRQRVAIARAVLADPRILILDEATSSLDTESEALIRDGLRSLRHGRTTFVIAHRLSTIESADQILVLEHGEIVERGTHRELISLGGRYRQLYERQYGVETDRFINPGEDPTPVASPDERLLI
jgi:ABC-type multidrug transport system fused ATPase/permease subunit